MKGLHHADYGFRTVSLSAFGFLKHLNEHCNERGRGVQSQMF